MLIAAVVAVVVGGTVVAVAASSGTGSPPPPASLADAVHQALTAPEPDGVTARVTYTNNLLPTSALFGNVGSALLSGASGRLWLTNDGRGRIELQSDSGDVQIVWSPTQVTVYDASSNTVYKLALPQSSDQTQSNTHTPPTLAEVSDFLTKLAQHVDVSGATPTVVANQPAYEASLSPKAGSLLDSVRIAWDAQQGVPLEAGVYATGSAAPALELAVKDISYGAVADSDVDIAPPADAKVVDLGTASTSPDSGSTSKPITGLDAVEAGAGFDVVAPDSIAGRTRTKALLLGQRVVLVYGDNPGAIVVVERKTDSTQAPGMIGALPKVDVNGATGHELSTELGTAITWQQNGVGFVLLGSVPAATAESAAQDVK
jgi:outer membrane lipoprotein-sorting protein